MIKKLIDSNDELLHKRIDECSQDLDRSKLSYTLHENMFHHEGCGLAANQIGIKERAFVMILDQEFVETITCFNPVILKSYGELSMQEEGCLSYPDDIVNVKRPDIIHVKYEDEGGKEHEITLQGIASRIFQHELDHLDGINFFQRQ